jgi:multimeric flavodoxin WrbA
MTTLLILYHSRTGGTEAMARAALAGAEQEKGVTTRLLTAAEATPDDLLPLTASSSPVRRTSPPWQA